jgi:nucleoside 2-deoxyribosyltransferase
MFDMEDFTTDPRWQEWAGRIRSETLPALQRSKVALIMYSGTHEPKMAVELGYAILLGKPIIVAHMPQTPPPWKLQKIANYVLECDNTTEEGKQDFGRRLERAVRGL